MRNEVYLKDTVSQIVSAICETSMRLRTKYKDLNVEISPDVTFVTSQELEDMYPNLSPSQREQVFCEETSYNFYSSNRT